MPRANQQRRRKNIPDYSDDDGSSQPDEGHRDGTGEQKFRFCSRSAFLTYPRCNIPPDDYLAAIKFDPNTLKLAFAKQERHHDGNRHLHVYLRFSKKLDTTNVRFFDIDQQDPISNIDVSHHPNIKNERGRGSLARIWEYLCKDDGVPPTNLIGRVELYPTSTNFRKVYGDRVQWLNYHTIKGMRPPRFPIELPNGGTIDVPQENNKKRHIWIHGPPNSGKTFWLETQIYCYQNYKVADSKYPFDDWIQEQIVVYDDVRPKAEHLLAITNSSKHPRPVPGETRYHRRFIPGGLTTVVIVCNNHNIEQFFEKEGQTTISAIQSRFNEIHVEVRDD